MRHRASILVARDADLAGVREIIERANAGQGGAVFVVGESGIGKSRLMAAVEEIAFTSGMALLRGRASSITTTAPFRPITEALLSLLRTDPVDPADLGPYGPILGRLVPDWHAPRASRDGESLIVLAEAVLRFAELAGRNRGCLITLDDLQHADAETLGVLEYLVDNVGPQPTVLVGAIRDEDCAALELARSAARRDRCQLTRLGRLDRDDLRVMTGSCLGTEPNLVPASTVDLLFAGSAGVPFMVEELLGHLIDGRVLVNAGGAWQLTEQPARVPTALAEPMAQRVRRLGERARELLSLAAMFGLRFPLSVVQRAAGLSDRELLSQLHGDQAAQLVAPDEHTADWYAFHHQLSRDAVLNQLDGHTRAELAGRVADAVEAVRPGLPDEWCQVVAALRLDAGDNAAAADRYTEMGRRALTIGAADSAVAMLTRAWELRADVGAPARAAILENLLLALAEAGMVERALESVPMLDEVDGLDPRQRAVLHTRIAWAATVAGKTTEAMAQVDAARALLGPSADETDIAPIDVVAAHLALDLPGPEQLEVAEKLARDAARVAEAVPLPVVACQAWQLLGAITRDRDPAEATACLEQAQALATRHGLPMWEIHGLIRLGNDDALHDGGVDRLEQARQRATQAGAVTARYQAEASIALHSILRGDFATARELIDGVRDASSRLKLMETTQYVLLLNAVLAAHQCDRQRMHAALDAFGRWGGDVTLHAPRVHGLAGAFCSLLEEDPDRASGELADALAAELTVPRVFPLSGRYGLDLLLRALSGELDLAGYREVTASPASGLRWDRQFALFAMSVLLGRAGRARSAVDAVTEAVAVGQPYPLARNLGLRLVGEAALTGGWGEPVAWLRDAEDYFHRGGYTAVSGACRALLRGAGVRVLQHRSGADQIPQGLRSAGVTVREFEVLGLLIGRLGNREIAEQLHLSPRTVERHVSNLITKTGLPNRVALSTYATELLHP